MNLLLVDQETERLKFRKLTYEDFDTWLRFHQNPLSTQYWVGENSNPQIACEDWFKRIFHRYDNKLGGMNALICKEKGVLIGQCGLLIQEVDGVQELEIGYSILPEYWRKGYATEAAKKCRDYAFSNELTDSVISIIHVNNIPSQKVAQAMGMRLDKATSYKNNPVYIYRVEK